MVSPTWLVGPEVLEAASLLEAVLQVEGSLESAWWLRLGESA